MIPKRFRSELGERLILCRGFGKCISVFPYDMWLRFTRHIEEMEPLSEGQAMFRRLFVASSFEAQPDKLGRIQIPQALREAAGIGDAVSRRPQAAGDGGGRDIAVVGMREFCEIWSKAAWEQYIEEVTSLDVLRELVKDSRWKREMYRHPRPDDAD